MAGHKPNIDLAAPQGAPMTWVITEGVAKKITGTRRQMGGHISTYSTYIHHVATDRKLAMLPPGSA